MKEKSNLVVILMILLFSFYTYAADCEINDSSKKNAYKYYKEAKNLVNEGKYLYALSKIYRAAENVFPRKTLLDISFTCTTLKPGPYAPVKDVFKEQKQVEYNLKDLMSQILKKVPPIIYVVKSTKYIKICNSEKSKVYLKYIYAFNEEFSLKPGECKVLDKSSITHVFIKEAISNLPLISFYPQDFLSYYKNIMEELK